MKLARLLLNLILHHSKLLRTVGREIIELTLKVLVPVHQLVNLTFEGGQSFCCVVFHASRQFRKDCIVDTVFKLLNAVICQSGRCKRFGLLIRSPWVSLDPRVNL